MAFGVTRAAATDATSSKSNYLVAQATGLGLAMLGKAPPPRAAPWPS